MQLRQETESSLPIQTVEDVLSAPVFPSPRYFQVHFEYLHEIIGGLQQQVAEANRRMLLLQQRLDAMAERDAA